MIRYPVGTAPHFPIEDDKLHTPTDDAEVRKYQIIWMNWLKAKLQESEQTKDLHAIKHWKRLLLEFMEKAKIEYYVSPFSGKIE